MSSVQLVGTVVRDWFWNRARRSTLSVIALVAAGALSATLMLVSLGSRSLWFDETVSVEAARLPTGAFAHYVVATESNMALYHGLLHLWLRLGSGDAFARSLSVVFGLATLPLLYALARRLFDARTGAIAVLLIAANVNFVGHAREARGYSLAVLLVTASAFFLVTAVQDGRRRDWILCVIAGALATYAHLLAALAILAQLGSLVVIRHGVGLRRPLAAAGGFVLLVAPLTVALVVHHQRHQIDWVTAPRPKQLPGLIEWFTGSPTITALYFAGASLALAGGYAGVRHRGSATEHWRYFLLVAWFALPPLAAYAISYARPIYLYRYFLDAMPALVLLVAAGLARVGRAWIVVAAVLAVVTLSIRTTSECTPGCVIGDDDWRAAAAYVEARMRPNDGVIFDPKQLRTPFAHYMQTTRPALVYPAGWSLENGTGEGAATRSGALARAGSYGRIWLVSWWLPTGDLPASLARARGTPADLDFGGNVRVRLYGTRGS